MKKPLVTEMVDAGAMKRLERVTNARLVVKRADREIHISPNARATIIVRDLRLALLDLLVELEREG